MKRWAQNPRRALVLALALFGMASNAKAAAPRPGTADVVERGHGSFSLIAPSRYAAWNDIELESHPLLDVLLAPNLGVRTAFRPRAPLRVTGEYGLSMPTMLMRELSGYLFPSWELSDRRIGWALVPSVGLVVSYGERHILSGRLESAFRVPLGENDATPLDTYAPIELAFAPVLTGFRSSAGIDYDAELLAWLHLHARAAGYLVGPAPEPDRSPWYWSAGVDIDAALGRHFSVRLGATFYNYDQHETKLRTENGRLIRERVRSNDYFPTFDVTYTF